MSIIETKEEWRLYPVRVGREGIISIIETIEEWRLYPARVEAEGRENINNRN